MQLPFNFCHLLSTVAQLLYLIKRQTHFAYRIMSGKYFIGMMRATWGKIEIVNMVQIVLVFLKLLQNERLKYLRGGRPKVNFD
jgi:hypothetical protein